MSVWVRITLQTLLVAIALAENAECENRHESLGSSSMIQIKSVGDMTRSDGADVHEDDAEGLSHNMRSDRAVTEDELEKLDANVEDNPEGSSDSQAAVLLDRSLSNGEVIQDKFQDLDEKESRTQRPESAWRGFRHSFLRNPVVQSSTRTRSWAAWKNTCAGLAMRLCWYNEYCDTRDFHYGTSGTLKIPEMNSVSVPNGHLTGHLWAPVGDSDNEWVFIKGGGDGMHAVCKNHNIVYGPPAWGIHSGGINHYGYAAACC